MKTTIIKAIESGIAKIPKIKKMNQQSIISDSVERTRDYRHGDFTSNIAMRVAKSLRKNPRELAKEIADNIPQDKLINKIEIAGPGFINFHLDNSAYHSEIRGILSNKKIFNQKKEKILLEFVSANPTGPLHVGHGRHAAYGASLGNILEAVGYDVTREYYVNDAGRQMDILCISVIIHLLKNKNIKIKMPSSGYQGRYIKTISETIKQKIKIDQTMLSKFLPSIDDAEDPEKYIDDLIENTKNIIGIKDFNKIRNQSLESIKSDMRADLEEFGVIFDSWFSEQKLESKGDTDKVLKLLDKNNYLYEKEGAIWFKAKERGDEKDRVVVRENKNKTYFTSDIVYHHDKKMRGYDTLIDILGSDHHGYIARVKAGLEAMNHNPNDLEVELVQFVSLFRNGEKLSMSTRSGEFVTLRQLREEVGNDAARFFYIMRSNEQHLDFDLELAKSKSNENPVYYIQYAHARIASVLRQLKEQSLYYDKENGSSNLDLLSTKKERNLMVGLSKYSEVINTAAKNRSPHSLAQYLRDLANEFHSYYNDSTFIVNDENLRDARLSLIIATQIIISSGLELLGVSSPSSM
ncbi:MAG: arginine--tRNA ligase [Woeseiaceae bacterium]|nr:arginine--tRNA ligase [Woeseiaceae bacterium]